MRSLISLSIVLALLLAAGCSKTAMKKETAAGRETEPAVRTEAQTSPPAPEPRLPVAKADPDGREKFLNEYVYFDFDSALLNPEAQSLLQIKARWLQDHPGVVSVLVEGHCDERGTEAYNLALGGRRAEAVKKYLSDMGVGHWAVEPLSYGEEKPIDPRHNETAWAKNRRVCFIIN